MKLSVWENMSKEGNIFHSVTFERRYQDEKKEWKSSNSVPLNQVLRVAKLFEAAHEKLRIQMDTQAVKDTEDSKE